MPVLVFIDHADQKIKKSSLEALSYGAALAKETGTSAAGFLAGNFTEDLSFTGNYGVAKIYFAKHEAELSDAALIKALEEAVKASNADVVIFPAGQKAKSLAPVLAAKLHAGLVTGVISLPETSDGFVVKKAIYSGKAFASIRIKSAIKIICLSQNIFDVQTSGGSAEVEIIPAVETEDKVRVVSRKNNEEGISLTDAEIVVAGGMGLKGPENWQLVTDLAEALHAAPACSRPVSDNGWRPHHEHVGQTGTQISPNLYIAAGISGAIQHLGGVSRSKVIAAINKDADAPIFKVADYGMVGDLFEILPKLTEAVKKAKE